MVEKDYTTYFDKTPADMTVENVTYRSTDENIAKVDANGKISALAVGTAVVFMNADGVEEYVLLNVSEMKQTVASSGTSSSSSAGTGTSVNTNAEVQSYVYNSESLIFHKPSSSKLPSKNRVDAEAARDEMVSKYKPCKICKP